MLPSAEVTNWEVKVELKKYMSHQSGHIKKEVVHDDQDFKERTCDGEV